MYRKPHYLWPRSSATGRTAECSTRNGGATSPALWAAPTRTERLTKTAIYRGYSSGSSRAVYKVYEDFVIEGDKYVYLAQERLHWRWSKPANLTVNGPVKYAVETRNLFVMDEDGKEHEMEIVKKTLKVP